MKQLFFAATLKFDYGTFTFITTAQDKQSAIKKICKSENCSPSEITHICEHSGCGLTIKN